MDRLRKSHRKNWLHYCFYVVVDEIIRKITNLNDFELLRLRILFVGVFFQRAIYLAAVKIKITMDTST